jgi:hypothetical protein
MKMNSPITVGAAKRALMEEMIDYAGLFPPAELAMLPAVMAYAGYREGERSWALGRFVLPVTRLDEFLNAQENLAGDAWRLSGILGPEVERELEAVAEFNRKAVGAVMNAVEVKVRDATEINRVREHLPEGVIVYYEPAPELIHALLPAVLAREGRAKLRCGGMVEKAIPPVQTVMEFVACCAELQLPFKATAGLHHPLRGVHPLCGAANAPKGTMHGFVQLFTAAAMAWRAVHERRLVPREAMTACLLDRESSHFRLQEESLTWRGSGTVLTWKADELRRLRTEFAMGFGSCEFYEPLNGLMALENA